MISGWGVRLACAPIKGAGSVVHTNIKPLPRHVPAMLDAANRRTYEGAAVVAAAAVVLRFPLSFTGLFVVAGLLGGLVVGARLGPYESPPYHGAVAGALGAVPYAILRVFGAASEGFVEVWPAVAEVVGLSGFFVFGGAVGALVARRVAGRDARAAAGE